MSNHTKKKPIDQSYITFTESILNTQLELSIEQESLCDEINSLGYPGNLEDFLTVKPDIDKDQESASNILELQHRIRDYFDRKNNIENTILLEPSKLHESVNAVEKLLINHPKLGVYQRAGKLVRISSNPTCSQKKSFIHRSPNSIVIKELDQTCLTLLLTSTGHFYKIDTKSGQGSKIDCPEKLSRHLLAKPESRLPVLISIISAPTLREDGSILDTPGYDETSGMLFIPGNYNFNKIPQYPTNEDISIAKETLLAVFKDFPFENEASRSVAVGAVLTALIRPSIATAPLFGFTAPKMSSGKSLLADVVSLIATGKPNSVIAQADTEAEEKKRLLAILMEGDPIICYDNVEKPLGGASLCAILTQREYKDRLLGNSETRTVLTNATFLATGNNLVFAGDITTRTLLCKLDPQIEHPEERSFDVDLREYIPANRSELVFAGLTLLRAYHVAGRPKQNIKQFGRFEEWSNWIRSALIWIGMADPCETRSEIEDNDPIRIAFTALFCNWYEAFQENPQKIKEVISFASDSVNGELAETLKESLLELASDRKDGINQRVLAKKLGSFKNRIEGGHRLEQVGKNQGTTLWRVKKL